MLEWGGWAAMVAWTELWEPEWSAFIVTTSVRNVLRQNRSLFHWPESLKYPPLQTPILFRSGFEPMKESIMTPDKPGYWFDKTVGRLQSQRCQHCLHVLCILCSMHDETAATRRPAAPHLFLSSLLLPSPVVFRLWCEDSLAIRLCVSSA